MAEPFGLCSQRKGWDTHAGGGEIHIIPESRVPPLEHTNLREGPILRRINCRRLLISDDLRTVRDFFLGYQLSNVYVSHWWRSKIVASAPWKEILRARLFEVIFLTHLHRFVKRKWNRDPCVTVQLIALDLSIGFNKVWLTLGIHVGS